MAAGRDCSAPARRWRCPAYLTTLIRIRALFPPIELPQLIETQECEREFALRILEVHRSRRWHASVMNLSIGTVSTGLSEGSV